MNINPLDWHNTRYINTIPANFTTITLPLSGKVANILNWIEVNTVGRYAIDIDFNSKSDNNLFVNNGITVGFEESSDATMFSCFVLVW